MKITFLGHAVGIARRYGALGGEAGGAVAHPLVPGEALEH